VCRSEERGRADWETERQREWAEERKRSNLQWASDFAKVEGRNERRERRQVRVRVMKEKRDGSEGRRGKATDGQANTANKGNNGNEDAVDPALGETDMTSLSSSLRNLLLMRGKWSANARHMTTFILVARFRPFVITVGSLSLALYVAKDMH